MKLFYRTALLCAVSFLLTNFIFGQAGRENGIKLYKEGKYNEAAIELEKASKKEKTDAELRNYLGLAYIKIKDYGKAIKAFDNAIDLNRQNSNYFANLAYAYLLFGKLLEARETSDRALKLDEKNAVAYFIRAAANYREEKIEKAFADIDKAIAANPDYALAYNFKADLLLAKFGDGINQSKPVLNNELLRQAKEVLEFCLKNCRANTQAEVQKERIEGLDAFYDYFNKDENALSGIRYIKADKPNSPDAVVKPDESLTPVRITSLMPIGNVNAFGKVFSTIGAFGKTFSTKIHVAVLFAASGRITQAIIVKGDTSGYDLDKAAMYSALHIKYKPATKNGQPISQINIIVYELESVAASRQN